MSLPPARFTREALADLREAVTWIAREDPATADRLRVAVGQAARIIGEHPLCGVVRPRFAPERFRFLPLGCFPYLVVYEPEPLPPRILRVLHAARDLATLLAELRDEGL